MDEQERAAIAAQGFDPDFVALVRRQNAGEDVPLGEYEEALLGMETKREPLRHLIVFGNSLPPATLAPLLTDAWFYNPVVWFFGVRHVVETFRHGGFVADGDGVIAPTEPLTVYRGIGSPGRVKGLSWTLDEGVAERFAMQYAIGAGLGTVYAAEISPVGVLGLLPARGESEVVVDPRRLRKVRELRQVMRDAA